MAKKRITNSNVKNRKTFKEGTKSSAKLKNGEVKRSKSLTSKRDYTTMGQGTNKIVTGATRTTTKKKTSNYGKKSKTVTKSYGNGTYTKSRKKK